MFSKTTSLKRPSQGRGGGGGGGGLRVLNTHKILELKRGLGGPPRTLSRDGGRRSAGGPDHLALSPPPSNLITLVGEPVGLVPRGSTPMERYLKALMY